MPTISETACLAEPKSSFTPILIFKSNIDSHAKLEKLEAVLCREQDVHSWTVDLEDCDKVLRIITKKAIKNKLLTLLKNSGFEISDL